MGGALSPYRVLDLTTDRGWLTGKLLADLGADVVKVEPPGGDPGRRRGPYAGEVPHPEESLGWWFFNRGKRGITLDLDRADGRAVMRRLAADADVLVESFDPGWLAERGLGYDDLAAANPRLVYTSVSPFGQDGPRAGWAATDLVLSATGGPLWLTGDRDRPPVRISVPQYFLHAGAEAAVATMLALYHTASTGEGQHVDVAAQLATIRTLMNATAFPHLEGVEVQRQGRSVAHGHARFRMLFPCADGHVTVLITGGALGAMIVKGMLGWIAETDGLPGWLTEVDWAGIDFASLAGTDEGRDFFERVSDVIGAFFLTRTKDELYAEALRRRFLLAPVNTVADIRADEQLAAREYFVPVDHGERGAVAYPGPWAKLSATPLVDTPRAPRIGEHNHDVLAGELGLVATELDRLARAGVL
ncbi:MAG TPA: CoA transferase [Acidimicrobiales bacterium]|nr:CoA transferase [Acidimicrobiales bacterium]